MTGRFAVVYVGVPLHISLNVETPYCSVHVLVVDTLPTRTGNVNEPIMDPVTVDTEVVPIVTVPVGRLIDWGIQEPEPAGVRMWV
jgi:hypothetical protein